MVAKEKIKCLFAEDSVLSSSKKALDLYSSGLFGEYIHGKINYSFVEALYLTEKKKIEVFKKTKKLSFSSLMQECLKLDKKTNVKYILYKDLRDRGYILKTALKFGADFRVYDKGKKPGKEHAKWILYCVNEMSEMTWHEFSAKNRVAHSTKKNLLIGVVDSEGSPIYYEVSWVRP